MNGGVRVYWIYVDLTIFNEAVEMSERTLERWDFDADPDWG